MELISTKAPALVGLFPKSIYTPGEEARAMRLAIASTPGTYRRPLPVYLGHKKLGYVFDDRKNGRVLYRTAATSVADIEAAYDAGQYWRSAFYKNNTAGAGALTTIWYDMYPNQGKPAPPASPYSGTALIARAFSDADQGCLRHGPSVGSSYKMISNVSTQNLTSTTGIVCLFYDRCLAYDNCLYSASLQSMTNTVPSLRYVTNGDGGMQIGLTSITGTGAGPVTLSALTYVNSGGSSATVPIQTNHNTVLASRSAFGATYGAEFVFPFTTAAAGSGGAWIELAPGDMGVQNITNITWSAADGANTYCLFLARELAISVAPNSSSNWDMDQATAFMNYERVRDGAFVSFMVWATANNGIVSGEVEFLWT